MRLMLTAGLILVAGSATAQSVSDCRKIATSSERLACYDALSTPDATFGPQITPRSSLPIDPAIAAAEASVKKSLEDPSSARFLRVERRADAVCGFVNAKSASGGYTGAKLFVHVLGSGETLVLTKPEDAGGESEHAVYDQHCK